MAAGDGADLIVGYGVSRRNDHAAPFDGPADGLPLKIRMRYRVAGGSVADASPLSQVVAVPLTRHESTTVLASKLKIWNRRPPVPAPGADSSRPTGSRTTVGVFGVTP